MPEFELEILSPRERTEPKGEVWFGEAPRPTVVRERRRCWAWAAALVIGPKFGRSFVARTGRWPKRSTKLPAMEERRLLLAPGEGSGGELRSEEDIGRMGDAGKAGGLEGLEVSRRLAGFRSCLLTKASQTVRVVLVTCNSAARQW
jgi:hypothetical protein